jgi:hypothetical protein
MKRRETILVIKVPAEEIRALLHSTPSSDDFLSSTFPGQFITAFGSFRLPEYYYWPYYRLLVVPKGPQLLRLTYR